MSPPSGTNSSLSLGPFSLCFGRLATVHPQDRDRYGRTVARLECAGQGASAEQLRRGMAWSYTRYASDQELPRLEAAARAQHLGFWADPTPVPPWEWRKARR